MIGILKAAFATLILLVQMTGYLVGFSVWLFEFVIVAPALQARSAMRVRTLRFLLWVHDAKIARDTETKKYPNHSRR